MPTLLPDTLAERPGGGFDARSPAVFGMSGSLAVELAKLLDVIERDREFTQAFVLGIHAAHLGQVQHGVQQHGGVAVRQNKAVAIGPDRIGGVVTQELLPQAVGYRRQRHGRARMSGVRLLHSIHRQGADGVDAQHVQLLAGGQSLLGRYHENSPSGGYVINRRGWKCTIP